MKMCGPRPICLAVAFLLLPLLRAPASTQVKPGAGESPGMIVDYDGLVQLLDQKLKPQEILQRLQDSPLQFTLGAEEVANLQAKGATPELLEAIRKPAIRAVPSDVRNIAVVLDCSGSMLDRLPDGTIKADLAKQVAVDFIRRIKNGRNLSFVVFGLDPDRKCDAVTMALPLTEVTDEVKNKLITYIGGLQAAGHSPLAKSLEMAGAELAKSPALCMLVVISDGLETCEGDSGAVAQALTGKLQIAGGLHVVGIGTEPPARKAIVQLVRKGVTVVVAPKEPVPTVPPPKEPAPTEPPPKEPPPVKPPSKAPPAQWTEVERTLKNAKGKPGELEITLAWFNKNDLDLHVISPSGEEIFYGHRQSKNGGHLDVDMNVAYGSASNKPVEHVVWSKKAPVGRYKVYVDHYANHNKPDTKDPTKFLIFVKYHGEIEEFSGSVTHGNPAKRKVLVTEFTIDKAGQLNFLKPKAELPREGNERFAEFNRPNEWESVIAGPNTAVEAQSVPLTYTQSP